MKTLHLGTGSVVVLLGHRLCLDVAVVLIASIAIWISDFFTRYSVSLVAEQQFSQFQDVFWLSRELFFHVERRSCNAGII